MKDLKTYITFIFSPQKERDTITKYISNYVNIATPHYRYIFIGELTIVAYYTKLSIPEIKTSLNERNFPFYFMMYDITDVGDVGISIPEASKKFLLDGLRESNANFFKDDDYSLSNLLEVFIEKGWSGLTDKQREELIKHSNS